jgi:hypothetical protein
VPITFNLFRVRRFPPRPAQVDAVLFQRGEQELQGTSAQTRVTFRGANDEHGIETYASKHEMLKKVEGRLYDGREFHEFYKKNEVLLVLRRQPNLLLCKSSGTVAKDLVDELNEGYPVSFRADYLNIDFDRIRPQITELNGIWISQINQPNIDTLAMFGLEVDRSQLYDALRTLGHAASILIRQQVGNSAVPVIVSAKGSITFPQPAAEDEQIDRALQLYNGLLVAGIVEKESKKSVQEKREQERAAARAARPRR